MNGVGVTDSVVAPSVRVDGRHVLPILKWFATRLLLRATGPESYRVAECCSRHLQERTCTSMGVQCPCGITRLSSMDNPAVGRTVCAWCGSPCAVLCLNGAAACAECLRRTGPALEAEVMRIGQVRHELAQGQPLPHRPKGRRSLDCLARTIAARAYPTLEIMCVNGYAHPRVVPGRR